MFADVLIVGIVMAIPITAIITNHNRQVVKLKAEFIRDEIELEKLKQQNFIVETEKMKLELEKMKLDYTVEQKHILELKK